MRDHMRLFNDIPKSPEAKKRKIIRVLVADDSSFQRRIIEKYISEYFQASHPSLGLQIDQAIDGPMAVETYKRQLETRQKQANPHEPKDRPPYDIVTMDINMMPAEEQNTPPESAEEEADAVVKEKAGIVATREIREFEAMNKLQPAYIIRYSTNKPEPGEDIQAQGFSAVLSKKGVTRADVNEAMKLALENHPLVKPPHDDTPRPSS